MYNIQNIFEVNLRSFALHRWVLTAYMDDNIQKRGAMIINTDRSSATLRSDNSCWKFSSPIECLYCRKPNRAFEIVKINLIKAQTDWISTQQIKSNNFFVTKNIVWTLKTKCNFLSFKAMQIFTWSYASEKLI